MPEYQDWDTRPTLELITAIAERAGGSLTSVPYNATGTGTPSVLSVGSTSGIWGPFWERIAQEMKYLRGEFADEVKASARNLFLPEAWEPDLPSTGADKIQQANSQVFVGDPSIKAESAGGDEEDDLIVSQALNNLSEYEERAGDMSPLNLIKNNCIPLGLSIRTLTVDMDWAQRWSDEPERNDGESEDDYKLRKEGWYSARRKTSPIIGGSEHPLNVCYDRENRPMRWALIRKLIDRWAAKNEYPDWEPGKDIREPEANTRGVVLVRFWTPRWTACFIDGKPAMGDDGIEENPYGFIPLWPASGGRGHQDPSGLPYYELRGIMAGRLGLLRQDALDENLEQIYLQRLTYGPKEAFRGVRPDRQDTVTEQATSGPSNPLYLEEGESREPMLPIPIPEWLVARRERQDRKIDDAFGYDVQSGEQGGSEAASRTRIRLAQSNKGYDDAVLHMSQAEEAYYMAVLYCIKHVIQRPIDVNMSAPGKPAVWKSLKPEMIRDNVKVTVRLTGKSVEDKARELEEDTNMVANGLMSRTKFLQNRGDPNPQETLTAVSADRVFDAVYLPKLIEVSTVGAAPMVAQAAQEAGVLFTPEELKGALMQVMGQNVAAMGGQSGSVGGGSPVSHASGGSVAVNGAGTALPGTSAQNAESAISDNPAVTRPDSAEGMERRRRLGQQLVGVS